MLTVAHPSRRRRRHHRPAEPSDRQLLEQAGWRTWLDYRENHVRDHDGILMSVVPQWTGEAELARTAGARRSSAAVVATATADAPEAVWAQLRRATAELAPDHRRGVV